ncbi:MAG: molybdenum ABC transporter ATP-binding protein [Oligoflexus sp.]
MSTIRGSLSFQVPGFAFNCTFQFPFQGVTAVFGRSGSGKTSFLRCLAGLEQGASGQVFVGDDCWQDDRENIFLPPHKRPLAYVFQEPSLFHHLSIRQNLEYGWRRLKPEQRYVCWEQVIETLNLKHLLDRKPEKLSGGERQRVAIGRAILTSPSLLLMDEPLAALDLKSKLEILNYLEALRMQMAIPIIYVSHSIRETLRLADYLILLEQGKIQMSGELEDLLSEQPHLFDSPDETSCVLTTLALDWDPEFQMQTLDFHGERIFITNSQAYTPGRRIRLQIQARDVSISLDKTNKTSILNRMQAEVVSVKETDAGQVLIELNCRGYPLFSGITRKSAEQLNLRPNMIVIAQIKAVSIHS